MLLRYPLLSFGEGLLVELIYMATGVLCLKSIPIIPNLVNPNSRVENLVSEQVKLKISIQNLI